MILSLAEAEQRFSNVIPTWTQCRVSSFEILDPQLEVPFCRLKSRASLLYMNTIVLYDDSVDIPDGISDLAGFRRWVHSDDFPETGRICFLDGRVWVDMSKEQVFTHNQLKQEFNLVVGGLVTAERSGRFFPDGIFLTNDRAQLACQPDGTFVSLRTLKSGRVRLVEGEQEGYLELEGTPDMVLEIVERQLGREGQGNASRPVLACGDPRILARRCPG